MNKPTVILEIGGEGGSLCLYKTEKGYVYSTNESALLDLLDDLTPEDVHSTSQLFPSFDKTMLSMLFKYPVFSLYPIFVHPDFVGIIKDLYQKYKIVFGMDHPWGDRNWFELLNPETKENQKNEQLKVWESAAVNELERTFKYLLFAPEKINFLIELFLDYRKNHSFGEYDKTVLLSDEELKEREERMEFLTSKFAEVQNEIKNR